MFFEGFCKKTNPTGGKHKSGLVESRKGSRPDGHESRDGFILIAVLWISLLVSIFALNTATKSRLQGVQAMNVQEWPGQSQALHSALSRGYHEYRKYQANKGLLEKKGEWEAATGEKLELWHPRYEPYEFVLDGQRIGIRILNSRGRLDINSIDVHLLEQIVALCGASPGAETSSIANSILDWTDRDDLTRPGGAEKDYYLSLPEPYLPKNNRIQDIRELLLVKGVNRQIFYGTPDHPGLVHFFSVHGGSEKLDINSAAPETFAFLGEIPQEVIQDIIDKRMQDPVSRIADLGDLIPHGYFDQLQRYFTVDPSGAVEIQAFIILDNGEEGRSISRIHQRP